VKVIWTYEMELKAGRQVLEIARDATIVSLEYHADKIRMHALVPEDMVGGVRHRTFIVVGTGHEIEADRVNHIGTFRTGAYVFHVLEVL
jgi:hypothetical protein